MTTTIRLYVTVLWVEALVAGVWLLAWAGIAVLGSTDVSTTGGDGAGGQLRHACAPPAGSVTV